MSSAFERELEALKTEIVVRGRAKRDCNDGAVQEADIKIIQSMDTLGRNNTYPSSVSATDRATSTKLFREMSTKYKNADRSTRDEILLLLGKRVLESTAIKAALMGIAALAATGAVALAGTSETLVDITGNLANYPVIAHDDGTKTIFSDHDGNGIFETAQTMDVAGNIGQAHDVGFLEGVGSFLSSLSNYF
ncbi:MAG: hypothetical protein M1839_005975 [Geoglossum umbratile]|nr:MAG: hypothetical protein M1839_005975 [Geoglossum umbratile]